MFIITVEGAPDSSPRPVGVQHRNNEGWWGGRTGRKPWSRSLGGGGEERRPMAGRAGRRPGQSWDHQKPSREPALAAAGPSDREDTAGGGGQSPCQLARPRECRAREAASLGSPQGPTASRPRGKGTRRGSRGGRSRKVCPPGGSGRGEDRGKPGGKRGGHNGGQDSGKG